MTTMKNNKNIQVWLLILVATFLIANAAVVDASGHLLARRGGGSSSGGSSRSSGDGSRPSSIPGHGGEKSNNEMARASLEGNCKKINGKCVVFSNHGCANFYIDGYHYGHSQACSILHINCGSNGGGGTPPRKGGHDGPPSSGPLKTFNGINRTPGAQKSTTITTTTLKRDCTAGVDCPAADLGDVLTKFSLDSAYTNSTTHKCSLFWNVGLQDAENVISCKLLTGGKLVDVPNDLSPAGFVKGYPVSPGVQKIICLRGAPTSIASLEKDHTDAASLISSAPSYNVQVQSSETKCVQNPAVKEI